MSDLDSPRATPTELLAHAAWVRRLARVLVRDRATADDVEQQAWAAALERPPPRREGDLRHWWSSVVRNVARRLQRDATTRERHQQAAVFDGARVR